MKKRIISFFTTLAMLCAVAGMLPAVRVSAATYTWPLDVSHNITNPFSSSHSGSDFAVACGTPVYASASGTATVIDQGCEGSHRSGAKAPICSKGKKCAAWKDDGHNGSYANYIIIDHGNGVKTYYCHLKTGIPTANGAYVQQGQLIGYSGNAGNSTGPHLHFEIRINGTCKNPSDYLTKTIPPVPDNDLEPDPYYSNLIPMTAYLNGTSNVTSCNPDCKTSIGAIYPTDKCTIKQFYTNGWCQVEYPTSGAPKTGYVPISSFLCSTSKPFAKKTAQQGMTTYNRADKSVNIGSIANGDECFIVGSSGGMTQAIYPITGGKKLGWAAWSDPVPPPDPDGRYNPYCPIKGYILSATENKDVYEDNFSTRAGSIYTDDLCTINEVYSNGWCKVTYPIKSGTKTKYIKLQEFVLDTGFSPVKYTASGKISVYTKSNMASSPNWWISSGDVYFVVSTSGGSSQVLYPIDQQYGGGYKLGWIYTKDISVPTYTVSYNANGGTGAPAAQTKKYNETLTLSGTQPSRSGYSFAGWATSSAGAAVYSAGAAYTGNANLSLFAVWTPDKYTVSYNMNGGSGNIANQIKVYGSKLTLSKDVPQKKYSLTYDAMADVELSKVVDYSCKFAGWSKSKTAASADYAPGASFDENADTVLYAVWSNPAVGELYIPTRQGYTFSGWYTAKSGGTKISSSTVVTGSMTVYAVWTAVPVTTAATTTAKTTTKAVTTTTVKTTTKAAVTTIAEITTAATTKATTSAVTTAPSATTASKPSTASSKPVSAPAVKPVIEAAEVFGRKGETVVVNIKLSGNPGITALGMNVEYDKACLKLINASDGKILGSSTATFSSDTSRVPYSMIWDDYSGHNNYGTGTLARLEFRILDNAKLSSTPVKVSMSEGSTFNIDLKDIDFSVRSGSVTILSDIMKGDVNCDNRINVSDLVMLQKGIVNSEFISSMSAADINSDGKVDVFDAVALKRRIIG